MHSILYFRLKHVNASRCILMSILSPREQREHFLFRTTFGVRLRSPLGSDLLRSFAPLGTLAYH